MTYIDVITFLVSGFGAGLVFGIMFGVVVKFVRSLGYL